VIHPSETSLALYAGGDVPLLERARVAWHLRSCASCRDEVEATREAVAALVDDGVCVPEGTNWDRLAADMTANIHVGLEAAQCVAPPRLKPVFVGWRIAAATASVMMVLAGAWWINPAPAPTYELRAPRVEIRTTSAGLELNENGNALVLLSGRSRDAQRTIIVSAPGTLRARYVDTDTGQITINNVYSE
jgi:hypothetical protein